MTYRYMIALGSNLGNRAKNCKLGIQLLANDLQIVQQSPIVESSPLTSEIYDTSDHKPYLNLLLDGESSLQPDVLYQKIRNIENTIGHNRYRRWAPRELDIDILFWAKNTSQLFEDCQPLKWNEIGDEGLMIPHYDVWNRPFILQLLSQMNINWCKIKQQGSFH